MVVVVVCLFGWLAVLRLRHFSIFERFAERASGYWIETTTGIRTAAGKIEPLSVVVIVGWQVEGEGKKKEKLVG